MNDVLTGIERDVVIDYMRSELPVLSFRLNFMQDAGFVVPAGQYLIQQTAIIFSERFVPQYAKSLQTEVIVSFYFKKRGLFFNSVLQSKNNNCAVGIPNTISKIEDTQSETVFEDYSGKLIYATKNGQTEVAFSSNSRYPLFNPFVWRNVKLSDSFFELLEKNTFFAKTGNAGNLCNCAKEADKLVVAYGRKFPQKNPFPFEACLLNEELQRFPAGIVSTFRKELDAFSECLFVPFSDSVGTVMAGVPAEKFSGMAFDQACEKIMEQLAFVPAVSYMAEKKEENTAVQDRISPLELVYVSERYISFICSSKTIPFQPLQEYYFFMNAGHRTIKAQCRVRQVFEHDGKIAAICVFTRLNPEDKRFLYEKTYGTVYR